MELYHLLLMEKSFRTLKSFVVRDFVTVALVINGVYSVTVKNLYTCITPQM